MEATSSQAWLGEPALAPLWDPAALARFEPAERLACEELWRDVAAAAR